MNYDFFIHVVASHTDFINLLQSSSTNN